MRCFYHHDQDAVGTCKSCQRGLCPACAVDLNQGLACRARCEGDVRGLIQLIENNVRLSPTSVALIRSSRRTGIIASGFYLLIGLLFAGWGIYEYNEHPSLFLISLGTAFFIYGLLSMVRVLRVAMPEDPPAD